MPPPKQKRTLLGYQYPLTAATHITVTIRNYGESIPFVHTLYVVTQSERQSYASPTHFASLSVSRWGPWRTPEKRASVAAIDRITELDMRSSPLASIAQLSAAAYRQNTAGNRPRPLRKKKHGAICNYISVGTCAEG